MSVIAITDSLNAARAKLTPTKRVERSAPALAAAMLAAISALTLAGAVILGPGVEGAGPAAPVSAEP